MPKLPLFTAPQNDAGADFRWFVYGSSLNVQAFQAWAKEHGYAVPDFARAEVARLDGWRLAWNVRSNFWGGTVASLVEAPGEHVEGIALPMAASALGLVQHKEGVVSGLYEERRAKCTLKSGAVVDCKVFVAAPAKTGPEGAPSARFLTTILDGAKAHGLSAEWIAKLEKGGK